jgi:hypothetical protein
MIDLPLEALHELNGYIGSIAIGHNPAEICVTSPRGGVVHIYRNGVLDRTVRRRDIGGVARSGQSFALTDGTGVFMDLSMGIALEHHHKDRAWDNHLVSLG